MGKPGGFFKRLKARTKREASRKSRGTSGASKAERIAKHNESVEFHRAQRLADQLDAVSESSDDVASSAGSDVADQSSALARLRQSLGVSAASRDDDDVSEALPDSETEDKEVDEQVEEELEEVDADRHNDDQDDEEDDVVGEEDELEDAAADSQDEEVDDHHEAEFVEEGDEEDGSRQMLLLESYRLSGARRTNAQLTGRCCSTRDPYWRKYHGDRFGKPDDSPFADVAGGDPAADVLARATAKASSLCKSLTADVDSYFHPALWQRWTEYRKREGRATTLLPSERAYLVYLTSYADLLDVTRTFDNAQHKMELICVHLLNHWFKSEAVCAANDVAAKARESEANAAGEQAPDLPRDRGFGVTRMLVCLPMRNIARRYVHMLRMILGAEVEHCAKLAQFDSDFSEVEEAIDPTFRRRPLDYRKQFEGNVDDSFCFGLHLYPTKLHIYSHVLNSHLLICSPVGLRKRLEKNGDCSVALASIEVLVVDEAHVILMQNWEQLTSLMSHVNKRPSQTTTGLNDVNRIYSWALQGQCGRHRQNVFLSSLNHALISSTWRASRNNSGKVLLAHRVNLGVLDRVLVSVRQHFLRFSTESAQAADEDRFTFFTEDVMKNKIGPLLERQVRTILFVPSYFDFVRVRNYMYREYRTMYAAISEYASQKELRRALGQFTDLEVPLLIMTERFYFFKRYFVKHAAALVFYSPPTFAEFYPHLVSKLEITPHSYIMTLFCRYDTHELVRLCGSSRTENLLQRVTDAFSFVTQ